MLLGRDVCVSTIYFTGEHSNILKGQEDTIIYILEFLKLNKIPMHDFPLTTTSNTWWLQTIIIYYYGSVSGLDSSLHSSAGIVHMATLSWFVGWAGTKVAVTSRPGDLEMAVGSGVLGLFLVAFFSTYDFILQGLSK